MSMFKIVDTDNFGGDYPNEKFLSLVNSEGKHFPLQYQTSERAEAIADLLNGPGAAHNSRWWKVVPNDYKLQPGFEP